MINEKGEPLEKVKRMVYLSLITPISLKYRDYYEKKHKSNKIYLSCANKDLYFFNNRSIVMVIVHLLI